MIQNPILPEGKELSLSLRDDFDASELVMGYYAPRIAPTTFTDLTARPGWLRMKGQESGTSQNKVSLLARKLTGFQVQVTTCLDFKPLCYQHSAGLILYYDNMNFVYLHKYYSGTLQQSALAVMQVENGKK